jgi:hypothetical protein
VRSVAAQFLLRGSHLVKVRQRRDRKGGDARGPQHLRATQIVPAPCDPDARGGFANVLNPDPLASDGVLPWRGDRPLRDFESRQLRKLTRHSGDADRVRRMLALALIYDGGSRSERARAGGGGLRTFRDCALPSMRWARRDW